MQLKDKVVYTPDFAWGIFTYDDTQDAETWNLHTTCWNRTRVGLIASMIDGKTRIRKIAFQVIEKDSK